MIDSAEKTATPSPPRNPRIELITLVFIFLVSGLLMWWGTKTRSAFLTLLSILLALALIRLALWLRRSSFREFGLKSPESWLKTILLAAGGLVTIYVVVVLTMPAVIRLTGE